MNIIQKVGSLLMVTTMAFSIFAQETKVSTKDIPADKVNIIVHGSEAFMPGFKAVLEEFGKEMHHKHVFVETAANGSTYGIMSLKEGQCDMAFSSRQMTKEEEDEFKAAGIEITEMYIAKEAFVIAVNKSNPVTKLTKKQVGDIFSGKITNWKEVGGNIETIRIFIRSNTSGCYKGFKDIFLDKGDYTPKALMMASNKELKANVLKNKSATCYLGFASLTKDVKAVKISTNDVDYVSPTYETIKNGTYPIFRKFYVYYKKTSQGKIQILLDYLKSQKGSDTLGKHDFIVAAHQ